MLGEHLLAYSTTLGTAHKPHKHKTSNDKSQRSEDRPASNIISFISPTRTNRRLRACRGAAGFLLIGANSSCLCSTPFLFHLYVSPLTGEPFFPLGFLGLLLLCLSSTSFSQDELAQRGPIAHAVMPIKVGILQGSFRVKRDHLICRKRPKLFSLPGDSDLKRFTHGKEPQRRPAN